MEKEIITKSARATEIAGEEFAKSLRIGDIVILTGNLGAGKTTFVGGMAKAFSIKNRVISPTFVLLRKHRGKLGSEKINLYHIDLYRLENVNDIKNIGLDDIFADESGIFIFEWGEKSDTLKADWEVGFQIKENTRIIKIKGR